MKVLLVNAVVGLVAVLVVGAAAAPPPTEAEMAAGLARAHEVGRESPQFVETLQPLAQGFQTVEVGTTPGQATWQRVTLNKLGKRVDAIRFRTPKAEAGKPAGDMAWAFTFGAESVDVWYICPVEGKMQQGFQNFFKLKRDALTSVGDAPADHRVIAQRLAANRLKPDTEYLLWFTFANERPAEVNVAINLVPVKGANEKAVVEALGLTAKQAP